MKLKNNPPLMEMVREKRSWQPMGHASLFRKYFLVCSFCVISSITILGIVLVAFASRYFERDKYDMMSKYVHQAATITAENYLSNDGKLYKDFISLAYSIVSRTIGAEVFLTEVNGDIVHYENSGLPYARAGYSEAPTESVPRTITDQAIQNGIYEETGTLQGVHPSPRYTVGIPVEVNGKSIGVVFASCPADDLMDFLGQLVKMFLISAIVVLAIASVFIYFITARLVKPLNLMLDATQSFSAGDFSKRVPVEGYDEIGQLSMAFNNMASTLASTETSRRSFVANVSHELKTPMTTISGFVDGILDGTVPEEKRDQYLQIVSTEVKRLSRLVRSMLDTARIEAGELQMRPIVFDISETVRQTVFTFEQVIEEKKLDIRGLDSEKIMVYADKDLMHQVVYNLVENAVKFVNVDGYIDFTYRSDAKMNYVAIRNSGEGLEKEEAPQLFERFYKSDKSRSLNKNGVGLGLHIVRSIINYHKGEIVVRSVKGEYTEFEFGVPVPPKTPIV